MRAVSFDSAPPEVNWKWLKRAGKEPGQFRCQLDRRRRGEPEEGRDEGDLVDLGGSGFGQFAPAVADVDVPEPGEAVDVLLAVCIPDMGAFAPGDHQGTGLSHLLQIGDRMEHERLVLINQVGGVPGRDGGGSLFGGDHEGEILSCGDAVSAAPAVFWAGAQRFGIPIVWHGVAGCLRMEAGQAMCGMTCLASSSIVSWSVPSSCTTK